MWQWTVTVSNDMNTPHNLERKKPFVKEFQKDYDSVHMIFKNQQNYAITLEAN